LLAIFRPVGLPIIWHPANQLASGGSPLQQYFLRPGIIPLFINYLLLQNQSFTVWRVMCTGTAVQLSIALSPAPHRRL